MSDLASTGSQAFKDYIFFNPFPDAGLFAQSEFLNAQNEFDKYIEMKASRTDGKAKTYIKINHNPEAAGGLSSYGDAIIYICGHGDTNAYAMMGQVDYKVAPIKWVGKSGLLYLSARIRPNDPSSPFRYVLTGYDLVEVLKWENLNKEVREIRFWACNGATSQFAKDFAKLAKNAYPKIGRITAYNKELYLNGGHKRAVTYTGEGANPSAKAHLVTL